MSGGKETAPLSSSSLVGACADPPSSQGDNSSKKRSRKRPSAGGGDDATGDVDATGADASRSKQQKQKPALPTGAEGGHILGNFPKYYDFHPAAPRLQPLLTCPAALDHLFPPSVLERGSFSMADLGCNDGTLTLLLGRELQRDLDGRRHALLGDDGDVPESKHNGEQGGCQRGRESRLGLLGVDIDENLVTRARQSASSSPLSEPSPSLSEPSQSPQSSGARLAEFAVVDLGAEEDRFAPLRDRFLETFTAPSSSPPPPSSQKQEQKQNGYYAFDLVTIFSTTMWVHLNHGDQGLERLLRRALSSASCLLIEPQDWSSYKSAQRRLSRLGLPESPFYRSIGRSGESPSNRIIKLIKSFDDGARGVLKVMNLGKTSKWQRDLLLFYREPPTTATPPSSSSSS